MKKILLLTIAAAAVVAGAIIYSNKQKALPTPAPVAEAAPTQPEPQPQEVTSIPKPQPTPAVATPALHAPTATVAPVAPAPVTEETNSIRKTVDALLTARGRKHEMLEQLRKDGQLDSVIAELQRRATEDPNNASVPTTLGEALLNKVKGMHDAGITDPTELGIVALQADQSFNNALKIDPKNWEAQYVKASSMYYWPADAARDNAAAQQLANLIDQQEAMPSQSDSYAMTYIALGKQYQKMGKTDEAIATWQLGAQKFPGNADLQKLKSGQ
jgi:tetratricopeptide (TPR) repeat protein